MQLDPEQLAETIATAMKTATAPLRARIELLEKWAALPQADIKELKTDVAALRFDLESKNVAPEDLRVVYDSAKADIAETFQEMLAKALAALPKPKDGVDGLPGRDGRDGIQGIPGANGADGAPGRDGTLENLKAEFDGDRTVTLLRKDGTAIEGGTFVLGVPMDRGVFRDDSTYVKGDGVTYAGSFFIAQRDDPGKPEVGDGWRLAVKRGRDGRNGKDGGPVHPVKIR